MIAFNDYPDWSNLTVAVARDWLRQVASEHGRQIRQLAYHFVNEAEILRINSNHLSHHYATDIITFGYEEGKGIRGEVFISLATVVENAERYEVEKGEELDRVIVHGLLHLCGFNDHSTEEKTIMRAEEEKCLLLRANNLKNK